MKRGLFGLIPLVLLLSMPAVFAAETFLDLITGTTDNSLIFLKVVYAMLVFIIFLKVSKETLFKKEQQNLGNIFSLLLAFFAFRYTPDFMIQGFGWVIMFIAPLVIFYTIYGVFVKKEGNKFTWLRFFLALLSTLILFFALGATETFSSGLGSMPVLGGFWDELFSDMNYLIFYNLSTPFVIFIAFLIIGLLFLLASRFSGRAPSGTFGDSFLKGALAVLGVAALLAIAAYCLADFLE